MTQEKDDLVTIEGVAMYAHLRAPYKSRNPLYGDSYTLDLLLDGKGREIAQKTGLRIKSGNEKYANFVQEKNLTAAGFNGDFISVNKDAIKKKWDAQGNKVIKLDSEGRPMMLNGDVVYETEPAVPPRVRDSAGNVIEQSQIPLIGNGSRLRVFLSPKSGGTKPFGEYGSRLVSATILTLEKMPERQEYAASEGTYVFQQDSGASSDDDIPAFARAG